MVKMFGPGGFGAALLLAEPVKQQLTPWLRPFFGGEHVGAGCESSRKTLIKIEVAPRIVRAQARRYTGGTGRGGACQRDVILMVRGDPKEGGAYKARKED